MLPTRVFHNEPGMERGHQDNTKNRYVGRPKCHQAPANFGWRGRRVLARIADDSSSHYPDGPSHASSRCMNYNINDNGHGCRKTVKDPCSGDRWRREPYTSITPGCFPCRSKAFAASGSQTSSSPRAISFSAVKRVRVQSSA